MGSNYLMGCHLTGETAKQERNRESLDSLEVYELKDTASEEDLAVAETLLANILVRQWLATRKI